MATVIAITYEGGHKLNFVILFIEVSILKLNSCLKIITNIKEKNHIED